MLADPMAGRLPYEHVVAMTDELLDANAPWLPAVRRHWTGAARHAGAVPMADATDVGRRPGAAGPRIRSPGPADLAAVYAPDDAAARTAGSGST